MILGRASGGSSRLLRTASWAAEATESPGGESTFFLGSLRFLRSPRDVSDREDDGYARVCVIETNSGVDQERSSETNATRTAFLPSGGAASPAMDTTMLLSSPLLCIFFPSIREPARFFLPSAPANSEASSRSSSSSSSLQCYVFRPRALYSADYRRDSRKHGGKDIRCLNFRYGDLEWHRRHGLLGGNAKRDVERSRAAVG